MNQIEVQTIVDGLLSQIGEQAKELSLLRIQLNHALAEAESKTEGGDDDNGTE